MFRVFTVLVFFIFSLSYAKTNCPTDFEVQGALTGCQSVCEEVKKKGLSNYQLQVIGPREFGISSDNITRMPNNCSCVFTLKDGDEITEYLYCGYQVKHENVKEGGPVGSLKIQSGSDIPTSLVKLFTFQSSSFSPSMLSDGAGIIFSGMYKVYISAIKSTTSALAIILTMIITGFNFGMFIFNNFIDKLKTERGALHYTISTDMKHKATQVLFAIFFFGLPIPTGNNPIFSSAGIDLKSNQTIQDILSKSDSCKSLVEERDNIKDKIDSTKDKIKNIEKNLGIPSSSLSSDGRYYYYWENYSSSSTEDTEKKRIINELAKLKEKKDELRTEIDAYAKAGLEVARKVKDSANSIDNLVNVVYRKKDTGDQGLFGAINDFVSAINNASNFVNSVSNTIDTASNLASSVSNTVSSVSNTVSNTINQISNSGGISGVISNVGNTAGSVAGSISNSASNIGQAVSGAVSGTTSAKDSLKTVGKELENIASTVGNVASDIGNTANKVMSTIDTANKVANKVSNITENLNNVDSIKDIQNILNEANSIAYNTDKALSKAASLYTDVAKKVQEKSNNLISIQKEISDYEKKLLELEYKKYANSPAHLELLKLRTELLAYEKKKESYERLIDTFCGSTTNSSGSGSSGSSNNSSGDSGKKQIVYNSVGEIYLPMAIAVVAGFINYGLDLAKAVGSYSSSVIQKYIVVSMFSEEERLKPNSSSQLLQLAEMRKELEAKKTVSFPSECGGIRSCDEYRSLTAEEISYYKELGPACATALKALDDYCSKLNIDEYLSKIDKLEETIKSKNADIENISKSFTQGTSGITGSMSWLSPAVLPVASLYLQVVKFFGLDSNSEPARTKIDLIYGSEKGTLEAISDTLSGAFGFVLSPVKSLSKAAADVSAVGTNVIKNAGWDELISGEGYGRAFAIGRMVGFTSMPPGSSFKRSIYEFFSGIGEQIKGSVENASLMQRMAAKAATMFPLLSGLSIFYKISTYMISIIIAYSLTTMIIKIIPILAVAIPVLFRFISYLKDLMRFIITLPFYAVAAATREARVGLEFFKELVRLMMTPAVIAFAPLVGYGAVELTKYFAYELPMAILLNALGTLTEGSFVVMFIGGFFSAVFYLIVIFLSAAVGWEIANAFIDGIFETMNRLIGAGQSASSRAISSAIAMLRPRI